MLHKTSAFLLLKRFCQKCVPAVLSLLLQHSCLSNGNNRVFCSSILPFPVEWVSRAVTLRFGPLLRDNYWLTFIAYDPICADCSRANTPRESLPICPDSKKLRADTR